MVAMEKTGRLSKLKFRRSSAFIIFTSLSLHSLGQNGGDGLYCWYDRRNGGSSIGNGMGDLLKRLQEVDEILSNCPLIRIWVNGSTLL